MKDVALIGIGKMGLSHLAIANATEGIKVRAVCDTSKALLHFLTKNTDFKGYTDYKKMIKDVRLDAIMINVPNALHFDIAQYCIRKNLHLFIEKPLTLSYSDSQNLIALAKDHNVKAQVGYVNRFNPMFQRAKSLIEDDLIGEVTNYTNRMVGGVITERNKGWRNDYRKGGGCLFDYGPHCFDLSTYLFGANAQVLSSVLRKVFSTDVDDIVYATLLHNDKIAGLNYINWSDSSVRKASNSVEVFGTKGKMLVTKQELSIFLTKASIKHGLEAGWNHRYMTDENTNVNYYLRGEDFSRQIEEFSRLVNGDINESLSSINSAGETDRIIQEIFNLAGGLRG